MDLNELLSAHPALRRATAADNERLLTFFEASAMEGSGLALRYRRRPDFFAFPKLHSDNSFVFFIEEAGLITAVGTVLTRPGYLGGAHAEVGYLGDLRIRPARTTSKLWRAFYSDLVRLAASIAEFRGARHFLTAIIDTNQGARQALVKPRSTNRFVYDPLTSYSMASAICRWPRLLGDGAFRAESLTPAHIDAYLSFNDRAERAKPFGFRIDRAAFNARLATWPGLALDDFLIVKSGTAIRAAGFLFSPASTKKILVDRYPRSLGAVRALLRLPPAGAELSVEYLCGLQIDATVPVIERRAAARALLHEAWRRKRARLLAYCVQEGERESLTGLGFLEERVPMTLYAVRDVDAPALPPAPLSGFEMALV